MPIRSDHLRRVHGFQDRASIGKDFSVTIVNWRLLCRKYRSDLAAVNREADGIYFATFTGAAERYSSSVSLRSAMVFSGTGKWIAYPK